MTYPSHRRVLTDKLHATRVRFLSANSLSLLAMLLALSPGTLRTHAQDRVQAAPLGTKVELTLETASAQDEYVLEARARLMEGEEWAPILQFRGAATPRAFVDAFCGSYDSRFFRLRRLLAAPPVEVSNFRLIDTAGTAHELYYQRELPAVILVLAGTNLSSILPAAPALQSLREQASAASMPIWVLSATETAAREALAAAARALPAGLPVLQDPSQAVHRTLGTGRAGEAVVVSTADWSIAYRGPIETSVDTGRGVVRGTPLADAVQDLAARRGVAVSRLENAPISSGVPPLPAASYATRIAPLLLRSCVPCHRPGDIAPWSMTNHATIALFSRLIKSAVLAGEMPPWHADPRHSKFANSKALEPDEVAALVDWLDRGAPRGDGPDPLETDVQPADTSWPLGTPDAVITIDPQQIPATGTVDYRYLFAKNPFTTNVWLRAAVVRPGDRSVVHHCLVFKGSIAELLELRGGLAGFFAGYVPGMEQVPFPEGTGKLLKPADMIILQMHYTTSGKAATDRTQLGLYLAPAKPARELVTTAAYDTSFTIPPLAADAPVSATRTFAKRSVIYELSPHMHYRGARARFTLQYPDGTHEVLLNVPRYFFDWQALYRLENPKEVPAGTRLVCEGGFDNSPLNRFNPDPAATVAFGEQSWEEMFIGYVNFAEIQ